MTDKPAKKPAGRKRSGGLSESERKEILESHPFTFVNLPLSDADKDMLVNDPATPERMCEFLWDTLTLNYKLGFSYDMEHRCHVISITGIKFTRDDYNRCVTSRHSDLWVALAIAEFKWLSVIKPNGIPESAKKSGEYFD